MDQTKQQKEFEIILNRARRAGIKVHHYPDNQLAVLRIPPVVTPPLTASDTPPAGAPATTPPPAQS